MREECSRNDSASCPISNRLARNRRSNDMKERFGPLLFRTLRTLERLLPISALYRLLKPFAFLGAILERPQPAVSMPGCITGPISARSGQQGRMRFHLNRAIEFFPDRLDSPGWKRRCGIPGFDQLQRAQRAGRGVILAFLHVGPFFLLRYWLRAYGLPVATLVNGNAGIRSRVKRMKDRMSPFPEIPTALYRDQLRETIAFLSAGNVLLIAIDIPTGKQVSVPTDGSWTFSMATGAIRLAARYGAELVPCCIIDESRWRFRIEFGRPVPREYLAEEPDLVRAGTHLLEELLPHVRRLPEQCQPEFIARFQKIKPTSAPETAPA